MKKRQLSLLLAAALLAAGTGACGTKDGAPSGQENPDSADTVESAGTETETEEPQDETADGTEASEAGTDTDVTSDVSDAGEQNNPVTVSFEENRDETKADDGNVIFTSSTQMPVVSIDGAADAAGKINADIAAYFDTFSHDEALSMAEDDYAASLGEDGWDFHGYSSEVNTEVTRMDDAVVSFRITSYDYTGGAHGNYGSTGRNYSTRTGELLTFDGISEDPEAFHATTLDYMVNLAESPAYKDKLYDTPAKADLDSALFRADGWIFTKSGLSLLAMPYELGPYASGEIAFMLPYEKAYEFGLKEDYRYSGNFVDEHYYIYKYDSETFEQIVDGTPDVYFDLDGDGTEEGLAFYGQVYDSAAKDSRYAYFIDDKDYGDVVADALDSGYLETTYALYRANGPDGGVPAIAVLLTEYEEGEDSEGNPIQNPYSYIFGYTKEKGLYYMYRDEGYVTLPAQP